jgi:hypothetical protein
LKRLHPDRDVVSSPDPREIAKSQKHHGAELLTGRLDELQRLGWLTRFTGSFR